MDGMLKAADEEWHKIPLKIFQNSLESWPDLVMAVHKSNGKHIPRRTKRKKRFAVNFLSRPSVNESTCTLC
jgi:hypothetical protein